MSSVAAVTTTATFQPLIGDIQGYLDWNRWMILGLTLWALLVAIVLGSATTSVDQTVPCAGVNVTATTLECTCQYPFPGVVWVSGLIIMGGVVVMEMWTDCVDVNRTKRKGVFPKEKSVGEMMNGMEEVVTAETVPVVLNVCQSSREAIDHAGMQALATGSGITREELHELVNTITTTLGTPEFKRMVEERTKSEAMYTKQSIIALLKPTTLVDVGVPSIIQSAVLTCLHTVHEYIASSVAGMVEGGKGDSGDKPKMGAEKASLRIPTTQGAKDLAKAMTDVIPDDKVMTRVQVTVQSAVYTRLSVVVSEMVNVGWFTILYRAITNFLIFYTIIALTSYNWFPIGKGCFVEWQSENQKAFTLLGIGFLSVVTIGIRITAFDLVDTSIRPTPAPQVTSVM